MLPCETPCSNKLVYDLLFEIITIWDWPERNKDSKLRAVDETPNQFFRQWIKTLWSIVSKAAERSIEAAVQ